MMRCDLVVVNYASAQDCLNAINSAIHHLGPMLERIIVVENGTGQARVFSDRGFDVIEFSENRGFAAAVNAGMERSIASFGHAYRDPGMRGGLRGSGSNRYVMILNPDAYLIDGPWREFLMWMVDEVAVAAPRVLSPDGSVQASTYSDPSPFRIALELIGAHRLAHRLGWSRSVPDDRTVVDSVQGSCLVVSHRSWKEVGPFDETFFVYHEETDWCLRARDKGFMNIYDPSVSIVHSGGTSILPGRELVYFRGAVRLVEKRIGSREAEKLKKVLRLIARVRAPLARNPERARGLMKLAEEL